MSMKFVFDLDGTICFKGAPLSKGIVNALDICISKGHEVVFASARPIRDILPILPKHMHSYSMVGGNGTFVAKEGKIMNVTSLDNNTVAIIRSLIEKHSLTYLIDGRWDYSYTGSMDHPIYRNIDPNNSAINRPIDSIDEMVKIVLFPNNNKELLLELLIDLPVQLYEHNQEGILDICPLGIDKWNGLQKLNIKENDFIAFGNDTNDVSMFSHAKMGICIGEHEELRSAASMTVSCNEQEIVDKIIELSDIFYLQTQEA